MLVENPEVDKDYKGASYCAIRKRKPDGSPNVGGTWLEPLGSCTKFLEDI